MGGRRLAFTVLFSFLLFSLLPLAVWLENTFGWPWLFLVVLGLILLGYVLLWPYRLLFFGLLIVLSVSGFLYSHGDLLFSLLLFLAPYGVACVAIAYRVAERLSPVEWVEPEYHDVEPEAGGEYMPVESRPRWNPYASSRPVLLRRKPVIEEVRSREAQREEDPCGDIDIIELMERLDNDPRARKQLHKYMECRARWFLEHFEEFERQHGIRVPEGDK